MLLRGKMKSQYLTSPCLGEISLTQNQTPKPDNSKEPEAFNKDCLVLTQSCLGSDDSTILLLIWILGYCGVLSRTASRSEEEQASGAGETQSKITLLLGLITVRRPGAQFRVKRLFVCFLFSILKRRELEVEAGESGVQRSYFQAFIGNDINLEITREAT